MSPRRLTYCQAIVAVLAALISCPAQAEDRALIVAIDNYADTKLSGLPPGLADNQVKLITRLLVEELGYKKEEIRVLKNKQATKSAILEAFAIWLGPEGAGAAGSGLVRLKGLDASGVLDERGNQKKEVKKKYTPPPKTYRSFFYFSGYGYAQRDTGGDEKDALDETLVPHDATVRSGTDEDRIEGMISDDELSGLIASFVYRDLTLVLDTSHSGHVTRNGEPAGKDIARSLAPPVKGAVKKLTIGGDLERHKADGPIVTMTIPHGGLTVWSAASPTQTALISGPDNAPRGVFTELLVEGLADGKADANANGIVSNAELLRHVSEGSSAYCLAHNESCEMGLRPRLDPVRAYGQTAWVDRKRVTHSRERRLTLSRLADFLGEPREEILEIEQSPAPPLHVGARDIRYRVRSPISGSLVLLNLTDQGELFQIYPNQFTSNRENASVGSLQANSTLEVPGETDGVKFSATVPAKGHIIAVMTPDPVEFDNQVLGRTISSVTQDELYDVYLASLSATLHQPMNSASVHVNTGSARWFVRAVPYEILP